ncbi:sugar phosphate isomerase/epimerase family protein [Gottfriedia solisilvae]|uniref:AP endonuclease n=1 Tax=Gottfriedia solisilvae TaxID=1516104 RepID=A0A8J3AIE3_9BACI|nr:sugar phosphate isomerase/epimerase family protein [Gottfriedia solisilvae]GGI10906.1 AP endonuclease [Gottfriedia solisilvae]
MLNLGVRAHDIHAENIEELVEKVHQLGLNHIQFAPSKSFPDITTEQLTPGLARHIKDVFARKGISISVLGCYINLVARDREVREKEFQKFYRYLRLREDFGASLVATETGSVGNGYTLANFTEETFLLATYFVRQMVVQAERFGSTIAVEAGINHPVHTIDKLERLLEAVPSNNIQVILDVANLMTLDNWQNQGPIIDEAKEKLGERIVAIHLKDFIIKDNKIEIVSMGKGLLDLERIVAFVKRERPCMYLLLEGTREEDLVGAVRWIRDVYEKV